MASCRRPKLAAIAADRCMGDHRKGLKMSMVIGFRSLRPALPGRATNGQASIGRASIGRKLLGLALSTGVAVIALQPNLAKAQFWGGWDGGGARPWGEPPLGQRFQDEDLLRPGEIADVLRDHGWTILSPPSMSGRHYVANVRNGYGQRLFVVLDAYDGRILDARQIEERPNTNELAAIPGGYPPANRPDEVIRPVAPLPAPPAPKARHSPSIQAKHSSPLRSTPLERPKEQEGTIAVAKPTATAPATKQVVPAPAPSAPETSSQGAPPPVATPAPSANVRQVYPGPGTPEPAAPAPKASAEAAPSAPPAPAHPPQAAPAPAAPAHPAQAAPAKPVLPADAGYE